MPLVPVHTQTDLPGGICPPFFFQMTVTSGSAFDWQRNSTSEASWTVMSFGPSMILGCSEHSEYCNHIQPNTVTINNIKYTSVN